MAKVKYSNKEKRTMVLENPELFERIWRDGNVTIRNLWGTMGNKYEDTLYSNACPAAVIAIKLKTGFGTIYSMGPQKGRDNG